MQTTSETISNSDRHGVELSTGTLKVAWADAPALVRQIRTPTLPSTASEPISTRHDTRHAARFAEQRVDPGRRDAAGAGRSTGVEHEQRGGQRLPAALAGAHRRMVGPQFGEIGVAIGSGRSTGTKNTAWARIRAACEAQWVAYAGGGDVRGRARRGVRPT